MIKKDPKCEDKYWTVSAFREHNITNSNRGIWMLKEKVETMVGSKQAVKNAIEAGVYAYRSRKSLKGKIVEEVRYYEEEEAENQIVGVGRCLEGKSNSSNMKDGVKDFLAKEDAFTSKEKKQLTLIDIDEPEETNHSRKRLASGSTTDEISIAEEEGTKAKGNIMKRPAAASTKETKVYSLYSMLCALYFYFIVKFIFYTLHLLISSFL